MEYIFIFLSILLMCGIAFLQGVSATTEHITRSLQKIIHRGSECFEIKEFASTILGANRLPIQGKDTGIQPCHNEDNTIRAIQNGEIFNYKELRNELEHLGHTFYSDCDTELWVHLYEEYQTDCVLKVDTEMFAVVIYDSQNNTFLIARDRLGVKPLYYGYHSDGTIHFASELKQLVQFADIAEVIEFPKGHFYSTAHNKGKFVKYRAIESNNDLKNEKEAIDLLTTAIVDAVRKRVDTPLPIGVMLSGGVDSSLVMEIATRFHPNVTALIFGYEESEDYKAAMRLCKDRKYKYHIITPDINTFHEQDKFVYDYETFEPLIINQGIGNAVCAKEAKTLGIEIVLLGEGADELFGGYNEFIQIPEVLINDGCEMLLDSLSGGHMLRVDRGAMKYTVEPRCPFYDQKVVELALMIDGTLKVSKHNHIVHVKSILRKVAQQFLPDYIAYRHKVPFSLGAGVKVGNDFKSDDGEIATTLLKKCNAKKLITAKEKNDYHLDSNYECYAFAQFKKHQYLKLITSRQRIIVKDNLKTIRRPNIDKIYISEFNNVPLYFPVYFAEQLGLFTKHNIEVEFINTGSDLLSYNAMANKTTHISLGDPIFSMRSSEQQSGLHSEIIGQLVSGCPFVAVTINPSLITKDFIDTHHRKSYRIGSYDHTATANALATHFIGSDISTYNKETVIQGLIDRKIDIAIVCYEDVTQILELGGSILYHFNKHHSCFRMHTSGFCTLLTDDEKTKSMLSRFLLAIDESLKKLKNDYGYGEQHIQKLFPHRHNIKNIYQYYYPLWTLDTKVNEYDTKQTLDIRRSSYKDLKLSSRKIWHQKGNSHLINSIFDNRYTRKSHEERIRIEGMIESIAKKKSPLQFIGFRGCSDKPDISENDISTIQHSSNRITTIAEHYEFGCEATFILSDMHGINNSFDKKTIIKYLTAIEKELHQHGHKTVWLSQLYNQRGFSLHDAEQHLITKHPLRRKSIAEKKLFESQAANVHRHGNYHTMAKKYHCLRSLEKEYLEKQFSDHFFFSYTKPALNDIIPFPWRAINLWTEKKGISKAPRFDNR